MRVLLIFILTFANYSLADQKEAIKELNSYCCMDLHHVDEIVKVIYDSKIISDIENDGLNVNNIKSQYKSQPSEVIRGNNLYSQNNKDKNLDANIIKDDGNYFAFFDQQWPSQHYQKLFCASIVSPKIKLLPWVYVGQNLNAFQKNLKFTENVNVLVVSSVEQVSQVEFYFTKGILSRIIYNYTFDLPVEWLN